MASINGRLVNGQSKVVRAKKAELEARFAYQRALAEQTAQQVGQPATWNGRGEDRNATSRKGDSF